MKWIAFIALAIGVPSANAISPVFTTLVFGRCNAQSYVATAGRDENATQRKRRFRCDRVTVDLLDRQSTRLRFSFPELEAGNSPGLVFTGSRQRHGQMVKLSNAFFGGMPVLLAHDSHCRLELEEGLLKSLTCAVNDGLGTKYAALVSFEASPGQSLGDDDDQP